MIDFKSYYLRKHGAWPGYKGDKYEDVFCDMCDRFADYVDEYMKELNDGFLERKISTRDDG